MNNKIICHQDGNLFVKCTQCEYSWEVPVAMNQEVKVVCPNCGNTNGEYLEANLKTMGQAVDIPAFMSKPTKVVTMPEERLAYIIQDNYNMGFKAGDKMGKQQGFSNGLCVGLIILGIVLFFLFAPMTVLPV